MSYEEWEKKYVEKIEEEEYNREQEKLRNIILSTPEYQKINPGAQKKHIKGTKEYNDAIKNKKLKSYFNEEYTLEALEELFEEIRNTGEIKIINNSIKEDVYLGATIGKTYNKNQELEYANAIRIHYSKKGAHIVPKKIKGE